MWFTKEHIADSYRIHQRLIRSRRVDARGWEFRSRGPDGGGLTHVRTEGDPSENLPVLLATLEDWRSAAVDLLVDRDDKSAPLAKRYRDCSARSQKVATRFAPGWLPPARCLSARQKSWTRCGSAPRTMTTATGSKQWSKAWGGLQRRCGLMWPIRKLWSLRPLPPWRGRPTSCTAGYHGRAALPGFHQSRRIRRRRG